MSASIPTASAVVVADVVAVVIVESAVGSLFLHCFPLDIVSPVQLSGRFSAIVLLYHSAVRELSDASTVLAESRRWPNTNMLPRGKPIVAVPAIVRIAAGVSAVRPRRSVKILLRRMLLLVVVLIVLIGSHIRRSATRAVQIDWGSGPVVRLVATLVVP